MAVVQHGMNEIEIGSLVVEALQARPYLQPQHHALFEHLFANLWQTGDVLRGMRKLDLPPDFFAGSIGGRTERQALEVLIRRISFGVYREGRKMDEERLRGYGGAIRYTHAQCMIIEFDACQKARRLKDKIVPLEKRSSFPLPGCKADHCACMWRNLLPRETQELGL